jgi:preprotein translocase SecE subunit
MASVTKNEPGKEAMADEQSSEGVRAEGGEPKEAVLSYRSTGTAQARDAGFFTIYKRGQGYWTRMGTAMGAALIAFLFAEFVYGRLKVAVSVYRWPLNTWTMLAIAAGVFGGLMLIAWRMMNKPSNADFLIATDSEMKKVNWTTRKELIGSTKVVIFFMVLISAILFFLDVVFGYFFHVIRVLEFGPFQ